MREKTSSYNKIFKHGNKEFFDYIITYNPHIPFNTKEGVGRILAKEKYGRVIDLSAEKTVRMMVGETDKMVRLLIKGLKDNGLYNNTVIVAYADHYLYTMDKKHFQNIQIQITIWLITRHFSFGAVI